MDVPVPGGLIQKEVDLFFRRPDGKAWHPGQAASRFYADTAAAGLPPIRFHDGRHAAATYLKAAGGDLLDMKKKLGHASITVTADTYPAGLEEIDRSLAERTAALIPRTTLTPAPTTDTPKAEQVPNPDRKHETRPEVTTRSSGKQQQGTTTLPEKSLNVPKIEARTGPGNRAKHRPDLTKTQGAQRNNTIPPAVFLAPTAASAGGADDMQLRPRRNRYPRDLK